VRLRRIPGDDELRRVYSDHVDAVYAYFAYSVHSRSAEDLTSATFEKVIKQWKRYDPERAPERAWILAIARNVLIDHIRRQKHRAATSLDEYPVIADALASGDSSDTVLDQAALVAWLAPLGDREREVLAMRYAADAAVPDIAEALGLTPANVHQIISRSLRKLRSLAEADASLSDRPSRSS
jgi:RNA polymerase sigma-70 factor (ECF subfamily)